jgi:hypothetical protein
MGKARIVETRRPYEEILALAEALPPEKLSRLICELSGFLHEKYGKWTDLKGVEEVQDYIEWIRFRDSHHPDGRRKSPEEFLAELAELEEESRGRYHKPPTL